MSQVSSPLNPSAKFMDYLLQPLACSYPDHIINSTALILQLQDLYIPDEAILVTVDVENLYPSIPQTQCLRIVYEQMLSRRHLLAYDPNLVIKLLHTNINYNYFQFAGFIFQQTQGTAMGTAFSPTVANIFLSVVLQQFLNTQSTKPILIKRYIDDIFIIWPESETLQEFLSALNSFHPNLKFTHKTSHTTVDFLDITVYKGPSFYQTHKLDLKTYQKPQNLYQYLEFTSEHPKHVYSSIILGECIRYVRTNTRPETYIATVTTFQKRLQIRQYPQKMVKQLTSRIKFNNRQKYLQTKNKIQTTPRPPIFKCLPPPQFDFLKRIIMQKYYKIRSEVSTPRFITLSHPTLHQTLVRAEVKPTDEQIVDIIINMASSPKHTTHITSGKLPKMKDRKPLVIPCNNPRCNTCAHLNCTEYFSSTITRKTYPIRYPATCTTRNIIYLITCSKCKKQYVGMTTKQLNARIHNHRPNIKRDLTMYMCIHFNLPDHSVNNLSVQVIEVVPQSGHLKEQLQHLERYWIHTLQTLQPKGLNNTLGTHM